MIDFEAALRNSLCRVAEDTRIPDLDVSAVADHPESMGEPWTEDRRRGTVRTGTFPLVGGTGRRGLITVLAVAAGVVSVTVSVAVVQRDFGGNSPAAAVHPTPVPERAANRFAGGGVSVGWVVYVGTGQAVAEWNVCSTLATISGPCGHPLVQTHDGWVTSTLISAHSAAQGSVTSDGSIALVDGTRQLSIVDPDGQTHRAQVVPRPSPAASGQALFGSGGRFDLWAYDPSLNRAHPIPVTPGITSRVSAVWAPDGRLWVEGWDAQGNVSIAWSGNGGSTWSEHLVAPSSYPGGVQVGSDGQVAAFAWTSQGATSNTSLISTDNGLTWEPFDRSNGPQVVDSEGIVGGANDVVTLADGTIFVVDEHTHTLWTSTGDWQRFRRVPEAGPVDWVQANADLLWVGHDGSQRIVVSSDKGKSWQRVNPQ
jgi:hypothetical protein